MTELDDINPDDFDPDDPDVFDLDAELDTDVDIDGEALVRDMYEEILADGYEPEDAESLEALMEDEGDLFDPWAATGTNWDDPEDY